MPKEKTITLKELQKEMKEKKQPFLVETETGMVIVWKLEDEKGRIYDEAHIDRIFKIRADGKLTELDFSAMTEEIAEYLEQHVPVKEFLKDVLRTTPPEDVIEIFRRIKKGAKVTADDGCFIMNIGGMRGKPFQLSLRE